MTFTRALLLAVPLTAAMLLPTTDAEACGGCFVQESENTQVSGHRMVLSVSMQETTLWDQIVYDGDPESFAWVLPIRGQVEVGLSSDAMFESLEQATQVTVNSPFISCPTGNCNQGASDSAGAGGAGGEPGVTVIAQEVVGPYETVQLEAEDPQALNDWLANHGYDIPSDVQPIITSYVNEGFGFLALRLVPGQGIDSMKPVRITSQGAAATLPLRMVAAGTGALTPISLWVLAEGRYEPVNMPSFTITSDELVWDWDTSSSNYSDLRQAGFDAENGGSWLIESASPQGDWIFNQLINQAEYDPEGSGYGDENGEGAVEQAQDDYDKLVGNLSGEIWITRMYAELTRPSLAQDLQVGAASDQSYVNNYLEATQSTGTPPECPPPPTCGEDDFFGDDGNGFFDFSGDGDSSLGSSSCTVGHSRDVSVMLIGLGLAAGLTALRRRRRR